MRSRDRYGQLTGLCSPWLEEIRLRQILPHLPREASVLDIGCGRGRLLAYQRPPRYVGLDVIPELIAHNRVHYPDYEFHLTDVESDDLAMFGRFDVALLLAVLEHVTDPEALLRKLMAHLVSAGHIMVTTPHPRAARLLYFGACLGMCSAESAAEHQVLFDRRALERLADKCGLCFCEYHTFLLGMNQFAVFRA